MNSIKVVIINHNCNQKAIALKKNLSAFCNPVLLDSGSKLSDDEKDHFDELLPNVYYNGLLNRAYELLDNEHTHLMFITSDVTVEDPGGLCNQLQKVTMNPSIGVYAPSAKNTTHYHQNNLGTNRMRRVTFTDGFCLLIPKIFLNEICPIDLSINKIGHGIDMYLGYLSMISKRYAIVDDSIIVDHPTGSGYAAREARKQRDAWYLTKSRKARLFHYLVSIDWLKNQIGFHVVRFVMRIFR